jgi:hypothetical protein
MPKYPRALRVPIEELARRYEAGEGLADLASDAGASYQTVGRRLQEHGVQMRGHQKTPTARARLAAVRAIEFDLAQLRAWRDEGLSAQDMADRLGCSDEPVRRAMAAAGIERLPAKARPERNAFWSGGYTVDKHGYILVKAPSHPEADHNDYVRLHRVVMARVLGRPLLGTEVVDHIDGDTSNNDPSNLRLFASNGEHLRATRTGRKKLPPSEREALRQAAVRRARARVAAILAESESGADPSP